MRIAYLALIIIAAGLIFRTEIATGQSDDSTFYIACTVELYEIAEYNHIELDENGCISHFISELQGNLEVEGIELIIESEVTENTQIETYFTAAIHGEPLLQVYIIKPNELPASRLIFSHPTPNSLPTYSFWAYNSHQDMIIAPTYVTGLVLYEMSRFSQAEPYFVQVLPQVEDSNYLEFHELYSLLGNVEISENNFERAIDYYEDAYRFQRLASDSIGDGITYVEPWWTTINTGWLYLQVGDTEKALSILGKIEVGSREPFNWRIDFWSRRAQLYALAFDYDSAIADMDAAIELAEANTADNELLAELYTLRGEIVTQHLNNQNQEVQRIVYIHNSGDITKPDYADNFFEDIQTRLADHNIEVRFETDETTQQIIFLALFTDSIRVDAQSRPNHRLPVTPIIYPNSRLPYCCHTNPFAVMEPFTVNEESLPIIEELVVGIALYQVGFYNDSYEILNPLSDELLPFYELLPIGLQRFINFYQANNLIMLGDYEAAINRLENTTFEDDINGRTEIINLAWLYTVTNRTDDALNLLNDRLNITSELVQNSIHTDNWINIYEILPRRAQLYALAFDYDSAIADMDAAIELAEANDADNELLAELYTLRGEIIFLIYEWDRVLENFNTALELDPDYAPAYFQRGVLYYTMTERENALTDFQQYLELAPDGQYAEQAQQYIDSIQIELDALGG